MKVTIKKLGAIKSAEINLKPLTIFIGPNNSGKTWLAYTIAGVFGSFGRLQYQKTYLERDSEESGKYPLLEKFLVRALHNESTSIDLVRFVFESGEAYFDNVAQLASKWLPRFLSSQSARFDELSVSISLEADVKKIAEQIQKTSLRSEVSGGSQGSLLSIRKKRGDKKMYVYTSVEYASSDDMEDVSDESSINSTAQLPPELVREIIVQRVFLSLHKSIFPRVRIFPTERTTFVALPYVLRRENEKSLTLQELSSSEKSPKSMIGPIGDFLNMMGDIFSAKARHEERGEQETISNPEVQKYNELASLLERQILGGNIEISESDVAEEISQRDLPSLRKVLFQQEKASTLETSIASSMVKELAPLALYLRYLARPNELVVIDEPEMNLHPEAQVKLIEFLSMLVNAGLNILITTHSPYFIDHLTNLIKANEAENKEQIQEEFYLKRADAFIAREKVAVYYVNNGYAEEATDEEGIGEWNTFGKVSDTISDIYFKL